MDYANINDFQSLIGTLVKAFSTTKEHIPI